MQHSRCHAFAQGSYSNLRTQFRSYFSFCVYFGREPLPADAETIYAYAQFLSRSLLPASVRNYLSGVRMLHIFLGLPYVHAQDFLLQLELRGISRLHPHVPIRAKPITPNICGIFTITWTILLCILRFGAVRWSCSTPWRVWGPFCLLPLPLLGVSF